MRSALRWIGCAALAGAAVALASCGQGLTCGAGTHQEGNACVADSVSSDAAIARDASLGVADASEPAGLDAGQPALLDASQAGTDAAVRADAAMAPDAAWSLGDAGFTLRCTDGMGCPPTMLCSSGACIVPPSTCGSDLECPAGRVCDYGACVIRCDVSAECGSDKICVGARCVAPPATCVQDGDCPTVGDSNTCSQGVCTAACSHECACAAGYTCQAGTCVARTGESCTSDEACRCGGFVSGSADSQHCFGGTCGRPCTAACDCSDGAACLAGRCRTPPPTCASDGDCPCAGGTALHCLQGVCLQPCATSCDCPPNGSYPVCFAGFCQVAPWVCAGDLDCPCTNGHAARCDQGTCSYGSCTGPCDCPAGMICQSGACTPNASPGVCTGEGDCLCGEPCEDQGGGFKFCGCTQDYFCPLGQICDLATRLCKAPPATCQSNIDCPWGAGEVPYRCIHNQCVACPGVETPCYGSDANCNGSCADGTPMICHHDLSTPDDDMNAECDAPCSNNFDCLVVDFGEGGCVQGRCTVSAPDATKPCQQTNDCPAVSHLPLGNVYYPVCQGGACLPASCKDNCDCPDQWPWPSVCQGGLCVQAPASCVSVDDCACSNMGQVGCNAGGVCGPEAW